MEESLFSILDKLEDRIRNLTEQNSRLELLNEELKEDNENLKRKAAEAEAARERAELDAEFLAVSHKLADNPDSLIATRRRISQLIRNIDRCLEMLKE